METILRALAGPIETWEDRCAAWLQLTDILLEEEDSINVTMVSHWDSRPGPVAPLVAAIRERQGGLGAPTEVAPGKFQVEIDLFDYHHQTENFKGFRVVLERK